MGKGGAHFDAKLPPADRGACLFGVNGMERVEGGGRGRYRRGPRLGSEALMWWIWLMKVFGSGFGLAWLVGG